MPDAPTKITVFEEIPPVEFGDIIPNFTFEVLWKANTKVKTSVEDMVDLVVMIPGSGEFVYDIKIQTKSRLSEHGKCTARFEGQSRIPADLVHQGGGPEIRTKILYFALFRNQISAFLCHRT